jgi:hypothetical protein
MVPFCVLVRLCIRLPGLLILVPLPPVYCPNRVVIFAEGVTVMRNYVCTCIQTDTCMCMYVCCVFFSRFSLRPSFSSSILSFASYTPFSRCNAHQPDVGNLAGRRDTCRALRLLGPTDHLQSHGYHGLFLQVGRVQLLRHRSAVSHPVIR